MNSIRNMLISFVEKNAAFFHAWGIILIILGFVLLLTLVYLLNKSIKSFRVRLIITIILIFPMIFLTLVTFLLTSPLNSFISTLSLAENSKGKPAPGFEFINLHDNSIHNLNEYRGKIIILNYWGTRCDQCETELQSLKNLENSEPSQLVVISISRDPVDSIRNYLQNHQTPSLTGICPGGQLIDPGSHLPFNIIIDKSGMIRGYFYGKGDLQKLKETCNKYLNESQQKGSSPFN